MKNNMMIALMMVGGLVAGDGAPSVPVATGIASQDAAHFTVPNDGSVSHQPQNLKIEDVRGLLPCTEEGKAQVILAALTACALMKVQDGTVGIPCVDQKALDALRREQKKAQQKEMKVDTRQCPAYSNQTLHRAESKNRVSQQRRGNALKTQSGQRGSRQRNGKH